MPRIRKNTQEELKPRIHWKIALYIRLSREDGNDESLSIGNQRKILLDYLDAFDEDYTLTDIYVDDGQTGTDYDRPNFLRMMHDIESKVVNCVIVKDLARPFRNYADQGYFLENYFPVHDVRFISLGLPALDSYKNPEMMNNIAVPIQGVMNDNHCRETSLKIRAVFDMKRRRGEFIGSFAPYGYVKDPQDKSSFIIDEETAQVVRDVFAWFVHDGYSKNSIARRLNDLGILNPMAYKKHKGAKYWNPSSSRNDGLWSGHTVTNILQNPVYIGTMVQGRYKVKSYKVHKQIKTPESEWFVVPNTHEPIIDEDTFNKAQGLQKRDTRTAPGKKMLHMLAGFMRCADCDKGMTRRTTKSHTYFACRTFVDKSRTACSKHTIREDVLKEAIFEAIQAQIQLVESLVKLVDEVNDMPVVQSQSSRLAEMLKSREKESERNSSLVESVYLDWKNGDISREVFRKMREKFEAQGEVIRQAIENIREEMRELAEGVTAQNPYFESFCKYGRAKELDREMLIALVNTVYVHEGGEIHIVFNFADQHRRVMEFLECNGGLLNDKPPLQTVTT
ncbi:MAG: recombinase family protein [Christensenellaceae bacterium]|jgi:hypothetical protein|nr:recombinase family protein [Christensenellaceae bacterium]